MSKIKRNAIQCNYCGHILESFHRHDYKTHYCEKAPKVPERKWVDTPGGPYSQELRETGNMVAPMMMVDGGKEYLRRTLSNGLYTDISEYEEEGPPEQEEDDDSDPWPIEPWNRQGNLGDEYE